MDQAPSLRSSSPSLADVSLQTGQSLFEDLQVKEKPIQLTKQTSTTQIPVSCYSQSLMTEPIAIPASAESSPSQETIKVLKTIDGNHDVIEIATKNVPSSQDFIRREQQGINPDDIVVDMKYQDAQKEENITSELNIQHATPQSFETVLVEPDDVTTEVVVDSDGTKRIIVRKLRRTLVTSRQTTQQHVSSLTATVGDNPPVLQAFSEATIRGQQVTVTTTKPDGTIEMSTKQSYGGKVTTGAPGTEVNVEEYESVPQVTHSVIQGNIQDIDSLALKETFDEGVDYQTKTSTVHAMVQQVTRRVIRKTRRIIRKVTIIDGKETMTEEVIEEPEEVEIDEQDIPHISINVVKNEDYRTGDDRIIESLVAKEASVGPDKVHLKSEDLVKPETSGVSKASSEPCIPESPVQGPFFGPFAKEMTPDSSEERNLRKSKKKKSSKGEIKLDGERKLDKESKPSDKPKLDQSQMEVKNKEKNNEISSTVFESSKTIVPPELEQSKLKASRSTEIQTEVSKVPDLKESDLVLKNDPKEELMSTANEISTQFKEPTAVQPAIRTLEESPIKFEVIEAEAEILEPVAGASCKSDIVPVTEIKTQFNKLEPGTVEVEEHFDSIRTVESDDHHKASIIALDNHDSREQIITKEDEDSKQDGSGEPQLQFEVEEIVSPGDKGDEVSKDIKEEPMNVKEQPEDMVPISKEVELKSEIVKSISETTVPKLETTVPISENKEQDIEILNDRMKYTESFALSTKSEEKLKPEDQKDLSENALKPEYTSIQKVEITLSVQKEDKEGPSVSIKTRVERPEDSTYQIVKEAVDIELPVESEKIKISSNKIIQTSAFLKAETDAESRNYPEICEDTSSEKSKVDKATSISERNKVSKTDNDPPKISGEESTSLSTTIAESVDINVPLTDSSKRETDLPEPDVLEIAETSESISIQDESFERDNGYEPDDRTTVEETTIGLDNEDDGGKKKRKKKKKHKIQASSEEDVTEFPKSTTDEAGFTDEAVSQEVESSKQSKKSRKKKRKKEEITKMSSDEIVTEPTDDLGILNEAVIQNQDVSPESDFKVPENITNTVQISLDAVPQALEHEIQTEKIKKVHSEMQTSPKVDQDTAIQTSPTQLAEIETTSMQTVTPEGISTIQTIVQTTPVHEFNPTTPPEMLEINVQTTAVEVDSTEMQTTPRDTAETETQTLTLSNPSIDMEQQTTSEPIVKDVAFQEVSIQTQTPDIVSTSEANIQTSNTASPEVVQMQDFNTQANLVEQVIVSTVETQTTPRESPRVVQVQESEIQTSISKGTDRVSQTSPEFKDDLDKENFEVAKLVSEGETQTSPEPQKETLAASMQTMTEELIPTIEEGVQIIPDRSNISVQTVDELTPTASVHQQTVIESVEITVLPDSEVASFENKEEEDEGEVVIITSGKETPVNEEIIPDVIVITTPEILLADEIDEVKEINPTEEDSDINKSTEETSMQEVRTTVSSPSLPMKTEENIQQIPDRFKSVATGGSTSMSETDSTTDNSYEIQLQATLKMSEKHSPEFSVNVSKLRHHDENEVDSSLKNNEADKAEKRKKKKKRHKTVEIKKSPLASETSDLGATFTQSDHPDEISFKLSYSDVTKKGSSNRSSEEPEDDSSIDSLGKIVPDLRVSEQKIQGTLRQHSLPESISIDAVPEPMDTTEELLSPTESVLAKKNDKQETVKIKTYAESIAGSKPNKRSISWEDRLLITQNNNSREPSNSSALILAEAKEYQIRRDSIVQKTQTAKMISERVKSFPNVKQTSHLSNVLHIATLSQIPVGELPGQRLSIIKEELAHLEIVAQEHNIIVMEQTLVTIVETISTWLETIEYRVFIERESPDGPSHGDECNFIKLRDEVIQIEDIIKELDRIWRSVEESYPEEEREKIQECVDALEYQTKAIEEITNDAEIFTNAELARWDEFLNGVNNVSR